MTSETKLGTAVASRMNYPECTMNRRLQRSLGQRADRLSKKASIDLERKLPYGAALPRPRDSRFGHKCNNPPILHVIGVVDPETTWRLMRLFFQ